MKTITAKKAYKIMDKLGLCYGDDGITYYATNDAETEVWEFESKKERDDFIKKIESER